MDIEGLFVNYRENLARLTLLDDEIDDLLKRFQSVKALKDMGPDIESLVFVKDIKEVQPGRNSVRPNISRTEMIAVILSRIDKKNISIELRQLARELRDLNNEAEDLRQKIELVKSMMEGLYERERFIFNLFYVEDLTWPLVRNRYNAEYNTEISDSQIRKIKRAAFDKLKRVTKAI